VALNAGAGLAALGEVAGLGDAEAAARAAADGRWLAAGASAFFAAPSGKGLRGASAGLSALFKSGGGLADNTIIGIRTTLADHGFAMRLSDNRSGYLFTNAAGEQVRLMREGAGQWYLRVRNAAGNYLDELGNPASKAATHLPLRNR
jgi:hypothetical protein